MIFLNVDTLHSVTSIDKNFAVTICRFKKKSLWKVAYRCWAHFSWSVMYAAGYPWWRHQMETFSTLLAICAGNSPVPGVFPAQRPVTRSFGVFFYLRLNKRLSKQSWGWWFETLSRPLWRLCNADMYLNIIEDEMASYFKCSCARYLINGTERIHWKASGKVIWIQKSFTHIQWKNKSPTVASSEFVINKNQNHTESLNTCFRFKVSLLKTRVLIWIAIYLYS